MKSICTKEKMQKYCDENNTGYTVLDVNDEDRGYQICRMAYIKCPNKNHKPYWVVWNKFYSAGRRCKECHYESCNKTYWDKEKVVEFYEKHNLKIVNINDWHSVDGSVLCLDKFGFKVYASISSLRSGVIHPSPLKYNPYALENIKLYCKLFSPDYRIVSDKYNGVKSKHLWEYIGDIEINGSRFFEATVDSFIHGNKKHPLLTKSIGEIKCEEFLIKHNIEYIPQKTFDDCVYKGKLRFDFYIPKLNTVIEFDGLQHYEAVEHFGGEAVFREQKIKDKIKNDYCRLNNINMLRIPYNELNETEDILSYNLNTKIESFEN